MTFALFQGHKFVRNIPCKLCALDSYPLYFKHCMVATYITGSCSVCFVWLWCLYKGHELIYLFLVLHSNASYLNVFSSCWLKYAASIFFNLFDIAVTLKCDQGRWNQWLLSMSYSKILHLQCQRRWQRLSFVPLGQPAQQPNSNLYTNSHFSCELKSALEQACEWETLNLENTEDYSKTQL